MKSLHSTAILKKFEFLRPFSRPLRKLKKSCFALDLNWKQSLFTTTSNVLPFKFKYWQQKLIPWNLVNLSHLYQRSYYQHFFHMYPKVQSFQFIKRLNFWVTYEKKGRSSYKSSSFKNVKYLATVFTVLWKIQFVLIKNLSSIVQQNRA